MESMLAYRVVSLSWRLKRADLIQNQTIDVLTQEDAAQPLAKIAKSLGLKSLGLLQPDPADSNPDLILGRIALKDFSNERVLDRLLMYERRIEHSLFKTTLELQRLRLLRNLESPHSNPAPEHPPFSRRRHDDALTTNSTFRQQARPDQRRRSDIRHTTYACPEGEIRKTNPIPKTKKQPQPLQPQRITTKNHPHHTQKNKPKQTQLVPAKPMAKPDQTQPVAAKHPSAGPKLGPRQTTLFQSFEHSHFEFVSDFVLRISSFCCKHWPARQKLPKPLERPAFCVV
jgi:hypothetical protein